MTRGCPHAAPLAAYLSGLSTVALSVTTIDGDDPAPTGFAGSPTILVEGINPFGTESVAHAACALHPPTVADLVQLLTLGPVGP